MLKHSRDWNYSMLGSLLPSELKLLSFKSELLPKLKYPLPALPLGEKDLEKIMKPALVSIKHALGLPRTTENDIIFFPKQYGDFATEDLHLEMLAQQAHYFIHHVRNGDSVGKQIQIIMSVY